MNKIKTAIKNLKQGIIPSTIINGLWHFTSPTVCSLSERLAGWVFVWLAVSLAIWTISTYLKKSPINLTSIIKRVNI